jgi:Mg-chelatase subunit ChlI
LPPEQRDFDEFLEKFRKHRDLMTEELHKVIVGQDAVIEQILAAIFTGGHCLLVGVPGLAKTLLVSTIARILDVRFKRIQFTPDLMPSDITGTNVLEEAEAGKRHFRFVEGPVFTNVLLADEINRTPPKTQAALLQAMQEHEVTIGQTTYPLPEPFFVIATQNPIEQEGTYPLPEAQLDRFMFNIKVDYPTLDEEEAILAQGDPVSAETDRPDPGHSAHNQLRRPAGAGHPARRSVGPQVREGTGRLGSGPASRAVSAGGGPSRGGDGWSTGDHHSRCPAGRSPRAAAPRLDQLSGAGREPPLGRHYRTPAG